jgi:hypothetical protein
MALSDSEIAKELTVTVLTTRGNDLLASGTSRGVLDPEKVGDTVGRLYRKILAHVNPKHKDGVGKVSPSSAPRR